MHTILSLGMGVDSVAVLTRWLLEPETRPCDLRELVVLTAQTGDEFESTRTQMETHLLPLMRKHNVRYVQVARSGPKEADGITVLDDSSQPSHVFLEGDYKLSDELLSSGVTPGFSGTHRCSLKAKASVLESWIASQNVEPFMHAFGYSAEETKRSDKCTVATARRVAFGFGAEEQERSRRARTFDTPSRVSVFPLQEWGWNRQACLDYLWKTFGVLWDKSCCVYCPFSRLTAEVLARHREHPTQVADAMLMERVSLSLNPRGTVYKDKSLIQITLDSGDSVAAARYAARLDAAPWALYRVRRIYQAKKSDGVHDSSKKGLASRAVERLHSFESRTAAEEHLRMLARERGLTQEEQRDIHYAYVERRGITFPAREEFYVAAPDFVATKARYGIDRFNEQWEPAQVALFA